MSTKTKNILAILVLGTISSGCNSEQSPIEEFNVIYILADDLGYGDLGCYGQTKIETPNIDRLATEGMLFTHHYAGSSVSAPSRSVLMTGLHTGHTPIRANRGGIGRGDNSEGQTPLPANTYTLGRMFQQSGYITGAFGKWGLGSPGSEGDPTLQGFDEFFGYNCQALAHKYYQEYLWHNRDTVWLTGNNLVQRVQYAPDIIHQQALGFIRDNASKKFFAFLPYILPHAELMPPEDDLMKKYRGQFEETPYSRGEKAGDYTPLKKSRVGYCSQPEPHAAFAATVSRLDKYVGDVLALVDSLGIREHTIIIFASDNGPHREGGGDPNFFASNGPFRGYKRDLYEGGLRVPMIASCPGFIPANSQSNHISTFWDVLPTFAELLGTRVPLETDGISMLPTLLDRGQQKEHDYLYWEFHEDGGKAAVRMGDWKGVLLGVIDNPEAKIELYNLATDIHENYNVADEYPEIVSQITKIMHMTHTPSPIFHFGWMDEKHDVSGVNSSKH